MLLPFFKASAYRAGSFGPRGGSRSPSIATRFVEVLSSFFGEIAVGYVS